MNRSTKDRASGKIHELKGKAREKVGQLTKNPNLIAEGTDQKMCGKIQNKIGQIEMVFEK